ncbi:DEAD/DEAH box helicase family protein [bacterium]|nr:DEAD/DEAH box helicase family protein [bacterium]
MAKFKKRNHQEDALREIRKAEKKALVTKIQIEKRALVIMASGLGKTVLSAFYAKEWLKRHGGRVLYLCDQNYILEQAEVTFRSIIGGASSYGFFHGQEKTAHRVTFLFSSFQTMRESRNGFKQKEFSLVIVDESHHSHAETYLPTLEYFLPKFTLAMTATPDRTDLKDIREIYGKEIFSFPIEKALAEGLLSKVDYQVVTDELQNLDFLKTPVGKLSIKALNKRIFVKKRDKEIADIIKRKMSQISNARTIIFCPSVYYCEHLSKFLPNSLPIHSKMLQRDQDLGLRAFRNGTANTILTVDKFNEGVDVPDTNVVIFLRSTASSTIFFQQLGRGLRKVDGKECVHVLDFVVNCERIEMLDGFWNKVKKNVKDVKKERGLKGPVNIDVGNIRFTSVARDVLNVIAKIRGGYTKEVLIQQLKDLAKELGRVPMTREVNKASKKGVCATAETFANIFGSFNKALIEAKLGVNIRKGYSKKELIPLLQKLAKKLGRTPKTEDVMKASERRECASLQTFKRLFGTFNKALIEAKLNVNVRKGYSKKELIFMLHSLAKELGGVPFSGDVTEASQRGKAGEYASLRTFVNVFGTFNKALKAAGMKPNHEKKLISK